MKKTVLPLLLVLSAAPAPTYAANQLTLDNNVFVERVSIDASGKRRIRLEEPRIVGSGDRLVFVLNYRNAGATPAERFVITNPMPAMVRFTDTGDAQSLVSVDGGRNWGRLDTLSIRMTDDSIRPAQPADVTHVRWTFRQPIPAGGTGKLMFRGVVR